MDHLAKLFKFMQITRSQPQYGYALAGVSKYEMSDLAQHQYLAAMVALQLAYHINEKGANLDTLQIVEMCLTHDLGELFGGDINFFYARGNPTARAKAKDFEAENVKYFSKIFGSYGKKFEEHTRHFEDKDTDESLVAQCADKIECIHYKLHIGKLADEDIPSTKKSLFSYAEKATNPIVRDELKVVIEEWSKSMPGKTTNQYLAEEVKEFN